MEKLFRFYRRHLPHFRAKGHIYFVTWRAHKSQPDFTPAERDAIVASLEHFDGIRYELIAYVVMNDHVHVLVHPEDEQRLEDILHTWKSFIAHELQHIHGRVGAVWQDESFDRIVRNQEELTEKMNYIRNNPRKRWPEESKYRWMWVKGMN